MIIKEKKCYQFYFKSPLDGSYKDLEMYVVKELKSVTAEVSNNV